MTADFEILTGKILTGEIEILTAPGVVGGGLFLSLGGCCRSCFRSCGGALVVRSVALCGSLCGVRLMGGVVIRAKK